MFLAMIDYLKLCLIILSSYYIHLICLTVPGPLVFLTIQKIAPKMRIAKTKDPTAKRAR